MCKTTRRSCARYFASATQNNTQASERGFNVNSCVADVSTIDSSLAGARYVTNRLQNTRRARTRIDSTHFNQPEGFMKRGTEQRTVRSFCRRMKKINLQPSYQRGAVWSKPQKQLLIDSILRDLDIPKIYLREIDDDTFDEEAVDGQQRLTAIYEFYNDKFALSKNADDLDESHVIRSKKFSALHEDAKDIFEAYELTVVLLRQSSEEEVEEMFLRLQNGTTLSGMP